ncbi:MAG: universal stress protein [Alphaproteobacteria bacterium]
MRKFLVPLSGQHDPDDPAALDGSALTAAFTLARRVEAHVEVFCIGAEVADAPARLAPWVPGSAVELVLKSIEEESENRRRRARDLFAGMVKAFGDPPYATRGADTGFSVDFTEAVGAVADSVAVRGRIADLVVAANRPGASLDDMPPILSSALRDTGRPVLIPGRAPAPESIGARVLVAWDGRETIARTLALTRDLLARADSVTIVAVEGDNPIAPSAEQAADYLDWHGIDADPHLYPRDGRSVTELLLDAAAERQADLLVLGASMRGTLQRMVTGDVMDELLQTAELPLLLAQ